MSFLYDQQKVHQQKLERFRQSFLLLTQDGQYPPDRQNRLYQATVAAGLEWNEARRFVLQDAEQFFQRHLSILLAQGPITPELFAELNRLRRRLDLDARVTGNLAVSAPPSPPKRPVVPPRPTPVPQLPATTAPSVWSDLKMIIVGVVLTPILWIGLNIVTIIGLTLLGVLIGTAITSKLVSLAVPLNFFLAIFFVVRIIRRRRRGQRQRQHQVPVPAPVYLAPMPDPLAYAPTPALPLNQYAPPMHHHPRLLFNGQTMASNVQSLSGAEFEHWVKDRLAELGWQQLRVMGGRGDRGVDIRGVYNGKRCIVQCKHYRGRLVPPNEVRALVGTRNIQKAQRAYLITSGQFSYQCFHEASGKPVELWDLETLATHLNNQAMSA